MIRPEIRAIRAYTISADAPAVLRAKLDFNESPFDVPAEIKQQVFERVLERRWALYPELGNPRLRESIARSLGRRPEEIVVGNGSGELLLAGVAIGAGSGGRLLLAPPTFSLYRQMAAIAGAALVEVPRHGPDFALDEERMLEETRVARTVPLVCTPNNPTGGVASRAFVERLLATSALVLVDQAYADFAEPEDDFLPLVDAHPNAVVFRTLSKAFSVAGFRIGYAVAGEPLARELEKGFLPYSVDAAAEELALAVLERPETARRTIATIRSERQRVAERLRTLGALVATSRANFLFFRPPNGEGAAVREALLKCGILIRDMSGALPGWLRVSIGTAEQNDLFLSALKEVV